MCKDKLMDFAILFLVAALAIFFLVRPRADGNLPPSPSSLPIIGHLHLLSPLLHHAFRDISNWLGPIFYLQLGSVPCVVASTPDLAKELLKTNEVIFSSRRMHYIAVEKITYNCSFAFAPSTPYWRFVKKLITTELLGNRMIKLFQPVRTQELRCFLRILWEKGNAGETVNVSRELATLTNNIISQMMLSMRCSGTDGQAEEARNLVRDVTMLFGSFNVSDFIWFCKKLDLQGFRKKINYVHTTFNALLERIITEREVLRRNENKDDGRLKDFLDIMLDVMEDENSEIRFSRDHIKSLLLDFFTAGTDTSSTAIDWALAELLNNRKALEKARKEIDEVVGKDRIVEESDCDNLPYIRAIMKEIFRLHPPVPMVSRRSTEECTIQGYRIPADSLVFVNSWAIGRDPRYWDRPLEFLPERFLSEKESVRDVKGHHFELLPFGTGRRGCPGTSLAIQALLTTLAAVIQCFDLKLSRDDEAIDMSERGGLTVSRIHDLVCVPVPRLPHLL